MITFILALLQSTTPAPRAVVFPELCLLDAASGAPIHGAEVRQHRTPDATPQRAMPDGWHRWPVNCQVVLGDSVSVRRIGYRAAEVSVRETTTGSVRATTQDTLVLALQPLADPRSATALPVQRIVGQRVTGETLPLARMVATATVNDARLSGAGSSTGLLALLPFVNLRSARGETGLSLRGARREQVAITLDGMPLNDPATGLADVSDLPLASLQSATVSLGADPVGAGSGANGGVLALTSGANKLLSLRTGALGQRGAEGAWHGTMPAAVWQASASWRDARNDFGFTNAAGAESARESRINNDERRAALSLGLIGSRAQLSVIGSTGERGMVGAANVRTYDADRSRTDRIALRAQTAIGSTQMVGGARWFGLQYRDPTRREFDSEAFAVATDVEWLGAARTLRWRTGGGFDRLSATGGISQLRRRGFASLGRLWPALASGRAQLDLGVRTDLIEGSGVLPSFSVAAEHRAWGQPNASSLSLTARAAQAVRVPTLYDLYFSSPQRVFVRPLTPERVLIDASLGARAVAHTSSWQWAVDGALVARDTRDAIIWFPGNFGWSPANVGMERLRGVEGRVQGTHRLLTLSAWTTAYRTELHTGGLTIPTPYVPTMAGGGQLLLRHRGRSASALLRTTGARPFTAGPRNPAFQLPAVSLLDLAVAQQLPWRRSPVLVVFSLENATNTEWQSVRGFPSPGRTWAISFTLQHSPT